MDKISLRVYNQEIDGMISGGHLEEAIAHCHHILDSYSMHIETYRLLGKAFLESRRYGDATDIFQRVLNAVPDDFVSHVGMSIIRDDEHKLDEAIWHMERAFEVQPSNPAIQNELRRLYGRRDGMEPAKIRLSRDALANMYAQGDLHVQAIAELRAILSDDPNRPDLQVMLARAYMKAGQKVESADVAAQLLRKFPYCMDALRVLVEVLPGTTRAENTQIYRQRLKMMDPYIAFTKGSVFEADQVAEDAVTLDRLEYKASRQPQKEQPEWATSLGVRLEDDQREESPMDWLLGKRESPNQEPEAMASPLPSTGQDQEIPEFLREAGWTASSPGAGVSQPNGELSPTEESIAKADMPDWLKAIAPADVKNSEGTQENKSDGDDDLPAWLAGLGINAGQEKNREKKSTAPFFEGEELQTQFPEQNVPDQVDKADDDLVAEIPPAGGEEISETAGLMDNLEEAEPVASASPETSPTEGEKPAEQEGVSEESISAEPALEPTSENPPSRDDTFPDWLTGNTPEVIAEEMDEILPKPEADTVQSTESQSPEFQADELVEPPVEISEKYSHDVNPAPETQLPDWLFGSDKASESVNEPPDGSKVADIPTSDILPAEQPGELKFQPQPDKANEPDPGIPLVDKGNFPDWMSSLFADTEPVQEETESNLEHQNGAVPDGLGFQPEPSAIEDESLAAASIEITPDNNPTYPSEGEKQSVILSSQENLIENYPDQTQTEDLTFKVEAPVESSEGSINIDGHAEVEGSGGEELQSSLSKFPEWMAGLGAAASVIGAEETTETPGKSPESADDLLEGSISKLDSTIELGVSASDSQIEAAGSATLEPESVEAETVAWLEGLAAKQDAQGDDFVGKSEDRTEELPDWLKDYPKSQAGDFASSDVAPSTEGTHDNVQGISAADQSAAPVIPIEEIKIAEDVSSPSEGDEASLAWLEDLEASHGLKPVDQEALQDKGTDEFADWLKGLTVESEKVEEKKAGDIEVPGNVLEETSLKAEPSDQVTPADTISTGESPAGPPSIPELPAWLEGRNVEGPSGETQPGSETEHPGVPQAEVDLPEWMKDIQPPSHEALGESKSIPADLPEWLRKLEEPSTEAKETSDQELTSWPPGEAETPVVQEATAPEEWMPSEQTAESVSNVPGSPETVPAVTSETMETPGGQVEIESPASEVTLPPEQSKDKDALLLDDARGALEEGETTESMNSYSTLIRKNRLLDDTIQDLRKASDRHPVDSIVWQTLGDAYMRAGRLQDALDAYTKAEELLK